jgi:O-antigen/teichoic acid export membrane protein
MIMWIAVARLMGKETYGKFIVIQSTLGMIGVFAGFGIGMTAIRYTAELRAQKSLRLGYILSLAERTVFVCGLIASTVLVLSASWMAARILNAPDLAVPLGIAAFGIFFSAVDSYQKSVLIGFESMRAFTIGTVVGVTTGLPIMLLAAKYYSLNGAAIALVITAILQTCISRYQMARVLKEFGVKLSAVGCLSERSIIWRFAFPALISGALVAPAHWVAQALLANTQDGYNELAVLGIAMQWFNVIMFLPATASRVVLPILTDYVTKNDSGRSRKILLYAMATNGVVAVPLVVIICVLSPYIMSIYGKNYENDYLPLVVAALTAALLAMQTPIGNLLAASSRMWLGALMNVGWAVSYIGLSCLLKDKGATGIMVALGVGYVVHATWTFWFALLQAKKNEFQTKEENV